MCQASTTSSTTNGAKYRERYAKETKGDGWYSFDYKGVHFIGLVNGMNLKEGGMRKVEGNVTFHIAMFTAFPQPAPKLASSTLQGTVTSSSW